MTEAIISARNRQTGAPAPAGLELRTFDSEEFEATGFNTGRATLASLGGPCSDADGLQFATEVRFLNQQEECT